MAEIYVGIGPWRSTTFSKEFEKCLENCYERWKNNSTGWYILKMNNEQYKEYITKNILKIDECVICWDDFNIAPTQKQIDFKNSLIFTKPLKHM